VTEFKPQHGIILCLSLSVVVYRQQCGRLSTEQKKPDRWAAFLAGKVDTSKGAIQIFPHRRRLITAARIDI